MSKLVHHQNTLVELLEHLTDAQSTYEKLRDYIVLVDAGQPLPQEPQLMMQLTLSGFTTKFPMAPVADIGELLIQAANAAGNDVFEAWERIHHVSVAALEHIAEAKSKVHVDPDVPAPTAPPALVVPVQLPRSTVPLG